MKHMLTKTATMKPTVTLDEKTGVHVVQQQVPKELSPKSKWLKYAGLCLLLIFLTTVTVFVVMAYSNTKGIGQMVDTDVVVSINGAKTDKQGDLGYVVTKFKDSEDEICYVSEFNVLGSIDGLKSSLETGGNETFVYTNATEEMYETTGETVNKTLLSPRAAELCADSQILRVVRSEDDASNRIKRSCYIVCGTVCNRVYGRYKVRTCTGQWWSTRCKYRYGYVWYTECDKSCYKRCV